MRKINILLSLIVTISFSYPVYVYGKNGVGLLPEDINARSEILFRDKTQTIFIEEDDPNKAVQKLNDSNNKYIQEGWTLFVITPYVEDEDFEGFFVTYKKSLTDN